MFAGGGRWCKRTARGAPQLGRTAAQFAFGALPTAARSSLKSESIEVAHRRCSSEVSTAAILGKL